MRFNGIGAAPLEKGFAKKRIVDYVCEIESSLFKSDVPDNGVSGWLTGGVNIIEVQGPGASNADCARLEPEWRQTLADTNKKKRGARQYGEAGRIRVLSVGKDENA